MLFKSNLININSSVAETVLLWTSRHLFHSCYIVISKGFRNTVLGICLVTKWCLTLYDPMDCILPNHSVHGILQARIQEWVAISFTRVFEPVSLYFLHWQADRFFITEPPGKPTWQQSHIASSHLLTSVNLQAESYKYWKQGKGRGKELYHDVEIFKRIS